MVNLSRLDTDLAFVNTSLDILIVNLGFLRRVKYKSGFCNSKNDKIEGKNTKFLSSLNSAWGKLPVFKKYRINELFVPSSSWRFIYCVVLSQSVYSYFHPPRPTIIVRSCSKVQTSQTHSFSKMRHPSRLLCSHSNNIAWKSTRDTCRHLSRTSQQSQHVLKLFPMTN